MRICTRCQIEKEENEYYNPLFKRCKVCMRLATKESFLRRYRGFSADLKARVQCSTCKKYKPFAEFGKDKANHRRYYCNYECKECVSKRAKKWYKKLGKKRWIQKKALKLNKP